MMKTKILPLFLMLLTATPVCAQSVAPADEVNMFMGVRGGSNCVIGPQLPHGSVNPAPQTSAVLDNFTCRV